MANNRLQAPVRGAGTKSGRPCNSRSWWLHVTPCPGARSSQALVRHAAMDRYSLTACFARIPKGSARVCASRVGGHPQAPTPQALGPVGQGGASPPRSRIPRLQMPLPPPHQRQSGGTVTACYPQKRRRLCLHSPQAACVEVERRPVLHPKGRAGQLAKGKRRGQNAKGNTPGRAEHVVRAACTRGAWPRGVQMPLLAVQTQYRAPPSPAAHASRPARRVPRPAWAPTRRCCWCPGQPGGW